MIVVALTNLKPVTLRSIEVQHQYEAYDLYSQNPNYIIAFVNNQEVIILGSQAQKESQYEILARSGYIFASRHVKYLCDEVA